MDDEMGEYQLSVCAIFQNESRDLAEWLHFHHGVGVEHFFLYDDASSDAFLPILEPWIKAGVVTLAPAAGRNQIEVYNDCLEQHGSTVQWLAFIDLDEFLFSPVESDLRRVLMAYGDVPAVFVYWVLFGSAGQLNRSPGYLTEQFTRCLPIDSAAREQFEHGVPGSADYVTAWARDGKSIVKPSAVLRMGAHVPRALASGILVDERRQPALRHGPPRTITCDVLRINHYWSKSIRELAQKVARASVFDRRRPPRNRVRWFHREACLNESEDLTIQSRWSEIRMERGL
jgi:hypothetical protein